MLILLKGDKEDYDWTMENAAQGGHWNIIKRMLELGADDINWAMVYAARKHGNIKIIEKLLELGANDYNRTLFWAIRSEDTNVIKRMLELGATNFFDVLNYVQDDKFWTQYWLNYAKIH